MAVPPCASTSQRGAIIVPEEQQARAFLADEAQKPDADGRRGKANDGDRDVGAATRADGPGSAGSSATCHVPRAT